MFHLKHLTHVSILATLSHFRILVDFSWSPGHLSFLSLSLSFSLSPFYPLSSLCYLRQPTKKEAAYCLTYFENWQFKALYLRMSIYLKVMYMYELHKTLQQYSHCCTQNYMSIRPLFVGPLRTYFGLKRRSSVIYQLRSVLAMCDRLSALTQHCPNRELLT